MTRPAWLFALAACLAVASLAAAQPGALPPGHPPVSAGPPPADRPASPEGPAAPPGHPSQRVPPGHPGTSAGAHDVFRPPEDQVRMDPNLPAGTVVAEIRDGARQSAVPDAEVVLSILRQTVAEGEQREQKTARTDAEGNARFDGLAGGSAFSYRVTVVRGPAKYASQPFNLMEGNGLRARLHVYPVTADIRETLIGTRAVLAVTPRDDVFQFEALFRFINVGPVTWAPTDLRLELPEGWKGLNARESMSDVRVVGEDRGVRIEGSFSPGQHEILFQFQVPNPHDETVELPVELPPHVMQMRVIAEASKTMQLAVTGFDAARAEVNDSGQRMLVADRTLRAGEGQMRHATITLSGLRTRGHGHHVALGLALLLVAAGLGTARRSGGAKRIIDPADAREARARILDEIVAVERAHRAGEIGPKTYERTRRALQHALARIVAVRPAGSDDEARSGEKTGKARKPKKRAGPVQAAEDG